MEELILQKIKDNITKLKKKSTALYERVRSGAGVTESIDSFQKQKEQHEVEEYKNKIKELEQKIVFLETKLKDITDKKDEIQKELEEVIKINNELHEKIDSLEQEKRTLEKEKQTLKTETDILTQQLSAFSQTNWTKFSLDLIAQFINEFLRHFRNSIGMLKEAIDICANQPDLKETSKEKIKIIDSIFRDLLNLISDAKTQYSFRDLILEEVRIHSVLEDSISKVLEKYRTKRIIINKKFSEKDLIAKLDRELFTELFVNILLNSFESMDSGVIDIETSVLDKIVVKITDNGSGIPEHLMEKVFNPFFTTKQGHSGLGLTRAYWICVLHNCSIEIDSQLNKGTTVKVFIPLK